jgi:hypothetical protein
MRESSITNCSVYYFSLKSTKHPLSTFGSKSVGNFCLREQRPQRVFQSWLIRHYTKLAAEVTPSNNFITEQAFI